MHGLILTSLVIGVYPDKCQLNLMVDLAIATYIVTIALILFVEFSIVIIRIIIII